jgi:hypothetical protein
MSDSGKNKKTEKYEGPKRDRQGSKTKPPRPEERNPKPPKKD